MVNIFMHISELKILLRRFVYDYGYYSMILTLLSLGYLSYCFNIISDYTQDKRNILSDTSRQVLNEMHSPIIIQAFASETEEKGRYFRKSVQSLISRYQYHKHDIQLSFVDPSKNPALSRRYGIRGEGEWLVSYENRQEKMSLPYSEEAFTNLLIKLKTANKHKIILINGQSNSELNDTSEHGLSKLYNFIKQHGWKIEHLSLGHDYPFDIGCTLLIAGPIKKLPDSTIEAIKNHILGGGNVIWLLGDSRFDVQPLVEALNLELSSGLVVDPQNSVYGLPLTTVSASHYAKQHELFHDFSLKTYFPNTRRVALSPSFNHAWKAQHLINVAATGWLSKSATRLQPSKTHFVDGEDIPGPISVAVGFERNFNQKKQHLVVIGTDEFLSNQYIDVAGNSAFLERLMRWGMSDSPKLQITAKPLKDTIILIPENGWDQQLLLLVFNGFQFVLPLLLFVSAFFTWRRKYR